MQNIDVTPIWFHITSVEHGWLFAELDTPGRKLHLANSHLGGLELPSAFLQSLIALFDEHSTSKWLCWHGESHGHIMHMHRRKQNLALRIFRVGSSFGLPVQADGLADKVKHAEAVLTAETDIFGFAHSVCDAFEVWGSENRLWQWQSSAFKEYFPQKEYQTLRKLLRGKEYLYCEGETYDFIPPGGSGGV